MRSLSHPVLALLLAAATAGAEEPGASAWALPPEGTCEPSGGLRGRSGDAPPLPFATGERLGPEQVERLRDYLPPELWDHRERFFYAGMQLEVGPCFRDYGPPDYYREATRRNAGGTRLLENGGLEGYRAGQPFPPETIAPDEPEAGLRWAWNFAHRHQGAGMRGPFRITDLVGAIGRAEPFTGEMFKLHLSHRSERPAQDYRLAFAGTTHWVAGGLMFEPFNAREYAWRQYRDRENEVSAKRTDDLHAYLPNFRRVRRLNSSQLEGIHVPSFAVGVAASGTVGEVGAAMGELSGTLTPKRNGFEGLVMRPLLYAFELLGVHDVLAPINAVRPMYPENPDREFGPWGLSFATDRWDLRRALVLRATRRSPAADRPWQIVWYLDLQTLHPLYYVSFDPKGEAVDVAMFAGRWSEDRPDYPHWPDDPKRAVRVIDSVGAAFANLSARGSWRRESWDAVAVPPPDAELKRLISVGNLTKRR